MKILQSRWFLRLVCWLGLCGLYLMFAANPSGRECVAAVACSTATVIFAIALRDKTQGEFPIHGRDLARLIGFPSAVFSGFVSLLPAWGRLLRGRSMRSELLHAPFTPSADDRGRKALLTIATTATPNSIVLGFDGPAMIYHQIKPADLPPMTRALAEHP